MGIRVYLHVRREYQPVHSLSFTYHTCVLAHVFWNTLFSLLHEVMHTLTLSDQELAGVRKESHAQFGRCFPEEIHHVHFLCLTSSPQESRWHTEKGVDRKFEWEGKESLAWGKIIIPSCWKHCIISEAFLPVSWGQPVHRWHHFGKSTL